MLGGVRYDRCERAILLTGSATDTASAPRPKSLRQRIPTPIWRFRPTLQPVAVVRTIKTQIIPRSCWRYAAHRSQSPRRPQSQPRRPRWRCLQRWRLAPMTARRSPMSWISRPRRFGRIDLSRSAAPAARQLGKQWGIRHDGFCQRDARRRAIAVHHAPPRRQLRRPAARRICAPDDHSR